MRFRPVRPLWLLFSITVTDWNTAGTSVSNTLSTTIRNMEGLIPSNLKSSDERKETRHPYYVGRNPPVNDLHPPIVTTTPYDTGSMKWMLQPPPAASIMNGKEKPFCEKNRSRTNSRASTLAPGTPVQGLVRQGTGTSLAIPRIERQLTGGTIPMLERQLTGKAISEEIKNVDGSTDDRMAEGKIVQRPGMGVARMERQLAWTGEETDAEMIRNGSLELTRIQTA